MKENKLQQKLNNSSDNAFICYNTEHVLTALLLSYTFPGVHYLYICNRFSSYKELTSRINELFPSIQQAFAIDDNRFKEEHNSINPVKKIIQFLFYKNHLYKIFASDDFIDPLNSSDIFLFHDGQFFSQYIVTHFDNLNMIEEGIGNYAEVKFNFASILKKLHGIYPPFGRNPRIKNIFVQEPDRLPSDIRDKGRKFDKINYCENISDDLAEMLIDIFLNGSTFPSISKNSVLLITQPFSEDLVISEGKKMALYEEIVDTLSKNYEVFIKPHPREKTDYIFLASKVARIFDNTFPLEIINFMDKIHFEKAVTLSSSAIDRLKPGIETIQLGDILEDKPHYFETIRKNLNHIKK
ncbi:MAG: glycosyltransferase family 52 protein [Candidatus Marinimicrobia bacterium]|nr:glycosyltransferase family 52 protein [Candidatus Neomarinimicrobiota bacterium]